MLVAWAVTRESGVSLEILRVYDVVTPVIEAGADLEITGDGFAQGHRATVTFEGTLRRPGREPDAVSVETNALALSRDRLVTRVDRTFERALLGPGGRGGHATFRGDLTVAFASEVFGRSRLTGRLRNVTFEVRAPAHEADRRELLGQLERFSQMSGFVTRFDDTVRELVVGPVQLGSRAARAGLVEGDVIAKVAGVRVFDPSDAAPAPADRVPVVVLRGDPRNEVSLVIDARGYAQTWPREAWTALFVFLALGVAYTMLALARGPSPAWVRSLAGELEGRIRRFSPASLLSRDVAIVSVVSGALMLIIALAAQRIDVVLIVGVDTALIASILFARGVSWHSRGAMLGLVARAFAITALVTVSGCATLGELAATAPRLPLTDFASFGVVFALLAWILGGAMVASVARPSTALRVWVAFDATFTATLFLAPLPMRPESSPALLFAVALFGVVATATIALKQSVVRAIGSALRTWPGRSRIVLLAIFASLVATIESRAPHTTWRVVATHAGVAVLGLGLCVLVGRAAKEIWRRSRRVPIW